MVIVSDAFQNYLDTGVLDSPPYLSLYQRLIKTKKPWGRYAAESLNGNTLLELGGDTSRDATTSNVTKTTGNGYGASAPITYLSETNTSTINFTPGSIPPTFTLCSITRYSGTSGQLT